MSAKRANNDLNPTTGTRLALLLEPPHEINAVRNRRQRRAPRRPPTGRRRAEAVFLADGCTWIDFLWR